jgi:hypothetical protein
MLLYQLNALYGVEMDTCEFFRAWKRAVLVFFNALISVFTKVLGKITNSLYPG